MSDDKNSFNKDATRDIEKAIRDIDARLYDVVEHNVPRGPTTRQARLSRVLVASLDGQEVMFPLFRSRLTIGRAAANDIRLGASCVSRHHALIQNEADRVRIIDWGSMNGVKVNSRPISGKTLRHGDTVEIGDIRLRYEEHCKRPASSGIISGN